jgi:hypothetical protein
MVVHFQRCAASSKLRSARRLSKSLPMLAIANVRSPRRKIAVQSRAYNEPCSSMASQLSAWPEYLIVTSVGHRRVSPGGMTDRATRHAYRDADPCFAFDKMAKKSSPRRINIASSDADRAAEDGAARQIFDVNA